MPPLRDNLTSFTRRRTPEPGEPGSAPTVSRPPRDGVPLGFDAVGEALASGRCPLAACAVVGRAQAADGASLGEALAGLRTTWEVVRGSVPDFGATEALSVAWSDATTEFLLDVSCEDPLTGLSSVPHLRSRLAEVFREAERAGTSPATTHALVVIDNAAETWRARCDVGRLGVDPVDLHFTRALRLAAVGEGLRGEFTGEETLARVGPDSVAALVRRTPALERRVASLRAALTDLDLPASLRLWVEPLPDDLDLAHRLLAELPRR